MYCIFKMKLGVLCNWYLWSLSLLPENTIKSGRFIVDILHNDHKSGRVSVSPNNCLSNVIGCHEISFCPKNRTSVSNCQHPCFVRKPADSNSGQDAVYSVNVLGFFIPYSQQLSYLTATCWHARSNSLFSVLPHSDAINTSQRKLSKYSKHLLIGLQLINVG
jgi:hypothetical protein